MPTPVIAIFDAGKTNKKLFLFDEQYRIVYERSTRFAETTDEDGDPCENLDNLKHWILDSLYEILRLDDFTLKAVNFSAYGASLVHIDESGNPVCPLYNYLKPYPEILKKKFYDTYGGETKFSQETASPVLGSLNSGMQLYRIKHQHPEIYNEIKVSLHLPQYLSFIVNGRAYSDITSIGCHTNLWDFQKNKYHEWVKKEGINKKLAPLVPSDQAVPAQENTFAAGVGLHDSSSALIPYLVTFKDPFALISTGTWCITLNPFNAAPLTPEELKQDCLCYLHYQGKPVKAARLFAGQSHDQQTKRIASHFNLKENFFQTIRFKPELISHLESITNLSPEQILKVCPFVQRNITGFDSAETAYHQLMYDIIHQQKISTQLVLNGTQVKRIFVDGGFSQNSLYMNLLAQFFPEMDVSAADMKESTALGAALAIHRAWNTQPLPRNIIQLKHYGAAHKLPL